jgi:DNA polymerase (family 10)
MGKEFKQFEIAGSYRRQKQFLKDLDVVIFLENNYEKLTELIQTVGTIENGGKQRITSRINGIQVDFRIVYASFSWYTSLLHFTGSKEENIRLRRKALELGMKLNEYELNCGDRWLPVSCERDVYGYLGEPFKEAWER